MNTQRSHQSTVNPEKGCVLSLASFVPVFVQKGQRRREWRWDLRGGALGSLLCLEFSPGSGELDLRQTQQGVFSELRTQGCPGAVASRHRLPEGLRHKYLSTPVCTRCLSQVHCSQRGKHITPFYGWRNWAGLRGVGNSTPYTHTLAHTHTHTHIYIYSHINTLSHTHIPPHTPLSMPTLVPF